MSRLTSCYSEGELSDSRDMEDDISISLSDDEQNKDMLDIKPPQPHVNHRSGNYKGTISSGRGQERRTDRQEKHDSDRKAIRSDLTASKEERRPERHESRSSRDSSKQDLRERLDRERRLRMSSTYTTKDHKGLMESHDRQRYNIVSKKERQAEKPREKYNRVPKDKEQQEKRDKFRRTKEELLAVSTPESDTQVMIQEEAEEAKNASLSSSSESSDDGGTSNTTASHENSASPEVSVAQRFNGQYQSSNRDTSIDDEPEIKRCKNEDAVDVDEMAMLVTVGKVPLVELKEKLPPYLPATMGCRSVGEFLCLNKIEEGTYGVVFRARDKRTDEIVALKRLKMEREKEGFPITSLREVSTLLKAQHENIVTVREIVVGSNMDSIYMVMDYVEHDLKSLMEVLKLKKQFFLPGEVKCLLIQLLRAVAYLHDNWILHRDLKTSNILLSHSGILKVGDFGLAREYGSPLKAYTGIVVTLWYRAPELLLGVKEYSTPIDVWSVGCIFGELLTLEPIFQGKSENDQINRIFKELGTPNDKIWSGYSELPFVKKAASLTNNPNSNLRKRFCSKLSELGVDLIQKFLTYDPQKRITAEEALKHTYLKESPYPIHASMLPTWPAKSESHGPRKAMSPKPPSGGRAFKQLGDNDDGVEVDSNVGFHMGGAIVDRTLGAGGAGFSLKF